MIRTLIHGSGRMGQRLLARLPEFENFELAGVIAIAETEGLPTAQCFSSLEKISSDADLMIDFTLPGGPGSAAEWCGQNGVALLSGTTGLSEDEVQVLKDVAQKVPVLWGPNLSYGVALISSLVQQAATALGVDADIHIAETHHKHKIDAPSGTALALAARVWEGRGDCDENEVGFSSAREGEVIGEHTVSFTLPGESVEITHKALDRDIFVLGALKAGDWLVRQGPGFYSTGDWLGLD
jgi:4-hydroxy-tetrahydrodipicolinate reductase